MPRQRKTMSGDPAYSAPSTAGVRYGEGVQLQRLQQSLPTPNARAEGAVASPPAQASQQQAPAAEVPALPMPQPGLLLAPSTRTAEPVTAGLRIGPGAGPEALGMNPVESPTGKFLRDLARITGRERFAEMARRSNL